MSLLEEIQKRKKKLAHTKTVVRTVEGKTIGEELVDNIYTTNVLSASQPGYVVDTKPDLQVAQITENLCMGSQDVACDENLLSVNNINHVISLGIHVNRFEGIGYTFVDVLDVPEFNIVDVFDEVFEVIDDVISKNGRVFVHCNAGVSRSATVVIGYLMKSLRLGFQEAFDMVRARRKCIKPNAGFVSRLKEYEKVVNVTKM